MKNGETHHGLSSDLKVWYNPAWKNKPFNYKIKEDNDGRNFYEDSIKVTIHDVYLMGEYANIMGTVQYYISGVDVTSGGDINVVGGNIWGGDVVGTVNVNVT